MKIKYYLTGGAVRDEIMGLKPKDLDFVGLAPSFEAMKTDLLNQGCEIFVEKPEFLTIRCKHPKMGCVDFAVARADGDYTDGRHPNSTVIAKTIEEDLSRRDFSFNAIAKDIDTGALIDPYDGIKDIKDRLIRAVRSAKDRFNEDALRAFRAVRLSMQKKFAIHEEICTAINGMNLLDFRSVSVDRVRDEITKMFIVSNVNAFRHLYDYYPILGKVVDDRKIWFKPTTEAK